MLCLHLQADVLDLWYIAIYSVLCRQWNEASMVKFMTLEVDLTILEPSCALNIYAFITVIENQVSIVSGAKRVIQLMRV